MLELTIPAQRLFDETNEEFLNLPETHLQLEHSLISLHKWESKWHVPFLQKKERTQEEWADYIRCMTINKVPDTRIYQFLDAEVMKTIIAYIDNPMTATWFREGNTTVGAQTNKHEIVTAEIIYYWMISLNIPTEFQKWHLNQLMTLIKVVSLKNQPKKKMSRREEAQQRSALNRARRAKYHSKG